MFFRDMAQIVLHLALIASIFLVETTSFVQYASSRRCTVPRRPNHPIGRTITESFTSSSTTITTNRCLSQMEDQPGRIPQKIMNVQLSADFKTFCERRTFLPLFIGSFIVLPSNARAATDSDLNIPSASSMTLTKTAFQRVRNELEDPLGGVAYIQTCIDDERYTELLEFTKVYDQVLRKDAMNKAAKLLTDKNDKQRATEINNGITFDLIGINRSSRPGQTNQTAARQYLKELRQDIQALLDLEPKE